MRRLGLGLLTVLLLVTSAFGQATQTSLPSQLNPSNTRTVSSSNAAAVVTLTGVTNQQWRVDGLSGYCSAGTSSVTVAEAGTTKWSSPSGWITTSFTGTSFIPPFTAAAGATVVITLATCGSSNLGTLNVQAERR